MKRVYFLMIFLVIGLGFLSYRLTFGFFTDTETSSGNTFTASTNFSTPTPTPTPTPSPSPSPSVSLGVNPGDVVINEVNWEGSDLTGQDGQNDEWLELRNMTSNAIDLTGWKITGAISGVGDLNITSGTVSANGFFLISNFNETTSRINIAPDLVTTTIQLDNSNAQYVLKDSLNNVIDTADDGSGNPLAGENANPKKSMERNDTPGNGTLGGSWHTAIARINMDLDQTELGTPKAANSPP